MIMGLCVDIVSTLLNSLKSTQVGMTSIEAEDKLNFSVIISFEEFVKVMI